MNRRQFLVGTGATAAIAAFQTLPASAGHSASTMLPFAGVVTHLSYFNTPYGDARRIAAAMKWLKSSWARDESVLGESDDWYDRWYTAIRTVHAATPKAPATWFCLIAGHPGESVDGHLDVLEPLVRDGVVRVIEGANEWDRHGGATWRADLWSHQEELYRKVKARFPTVSVAGPSLSASGSSHMGDLSDFLDLGNLHYYDVDDPLDLYAIDWELRHNRLLVGDRQLVATEANFIVYDGSRSSEEIQARQCQDLFALLGERGAHRVFVYELVDEPQREGREAHFGCFRSNWSAKPLAEVVRTACRRG